jgi:protease stability complex PrcB-like protein
LILKTITSLALSFFAIGFSGAGACYQQQDKNEKPVVENQKTSSGELKTLVEGSQSAVEEPFVAVIRDDETYARLKKMEKNLPTLEPDFFQLNVVVAAFLGSRNTGGYGVEISRNEKGQIRIAEKAPAKDAMTAQVITTPFKVVSFAPNGSTAVELSVDETFRHRGELYRVGSGNFNLSGGFTGKTESFQLNGKLQLTRLGNLVTIGFALVSSGSERERSLRGSATGFIKDGQIVINRLSHGSLIDPPGGELHVTGRFLEKNRLSLQLATQPLNVPESYGGGGTLEAELVAAGQNRLR